jgi:ATP-dependent DNA helicase RecG
MLLRMQKRKHKNRSQGKHSTILQQQLIQRLPFTLTADQDHVLEEINQDLQQPVVMTRLLQGDVGSGKTLVAFLAALPCIEAGHQVAFMAPTELLAQQHAENAAIFLEPLGIRIAILTGTLRSEQRGLLLDSLARGEIDIAMGTHALFSSDVTFHSLGLVIVDEQHRFGVVQRLSLVEKGDLPDLLLMTATPIPRTMALTVFGDLDISTIKTLPPGRKPVETHLAREGNEEKVYRWIEKEIRKGRQAYFVYPLIRQSDKMELKNAEDMFHDLDTNIFPEFSLGLIHSQLPEQEKEETMGKFVSGSLDILVSTSVVEVGVDVPNATCMVIEHAERFGLAALHQLRGRVGRSSYQSYAFLVFSESLTETGKKRLMVMKECNDGFVIAEEDLKMRGPGEITGTRQSGDYGFRIADPAADETILLQAREEARNRLQEDRALSTPDNKVIRRVLTQCPPFSYHYLDSG